MATYALQPGNLKAGDYEHGLKTSQTESRPRQSWINELRLNFGNQLVCAKFGCTNPATHGAHLRVSAWKEFIAVVGKGGQAVVPCCAQHHDGANGAPIKVKQTPCIWDKNSPYDF
uniref:Uncharacterized protein n=2 Tax=environmental samples TaxID=68359 RepID=A0A075GBE0_9EURY|nr:hypothetical protein [uncultured marine group II/III euryarchaeote AD1000_30_D02]AIF01396.1 hypothetical protein [uncultured marine group II/III euryarchaeote KM3_146_G03]